MLEVSEREKAVLVDGIPESNLVLFCPGLQGRGTRLLDRSKYANHGTITKASWARLPRGLRLIYNNDYSAYINHGHDASLNITQALTIEMWIKPDLYNTGLTHRLLYKGAANQVELSISGATKRAYLYLVIGGVGKVVNPTDTLPVGSWYHLVGVYNLINLLMYINTTEYIGDAANAAIDDHAADDLYLLNRYAADRAFRGYLGLPRIYNRALSSAEILRHYTRERRLFGV